MKIPFLDLHASYDELREEMDAAYHRVMDSGWYLLGKELTAFETEFAAYCEAEHCVAVNNGLDALHLTLRAMDIGAGDEVIVPAHTFIATWLAVTYAGATPVPVDVEARTFNLDPSLIEAAITPRTKAIMPVHLYGLPADMDAIQIIADRHGLKIIEDAAQAHGARYKGRRTGTLGMAAGFSFYPGKNLGAFSDGGALVTNDAKIAEKVRSLRNYGSPVKYHYEVAGVNSRMCELTAAMLRVKLANMETWNQRRAKIAETYREELQSLPGVTLPCVPEWAEPSWHLFVVRHANRDSLQSRLTEAGIGTLIHYPIPPHLSEAYREMGLGIGAFPVTESIAQTALSLPIGPHLSESDVAVVIASLRSATASLSGVASPAV